MCNHYNITVSAKSIAEQLSLFGDLSVVEDLLPSYRVDRRVGNAKWNTAECVVPIGDL